MASSRRPRVHRSEADKAEALTERIKPLLAGQNREVVSAALADVVAIFFAYHHPMLRREAVEIWITFMRELIPVNEAEIFKDGKPEGWEIQ